MSPRIAYLGPEGTFTEQATRQWDRSGTHELVPVPTVPAALTALAAGEVSSAVVPFENSVEGSVPATLQALQESDGVRIVGEELVRVQFSLLVRPGWQERPLRTVATHPHAAAQVRGWLAARLPDTRLVPETSTARAAQAVAEEQYDAAIAAAGAARSYGLVEAARGIADREGALTRFVVLRSGVPVPPPTGADRTTLLAQIWANRPGALLELLEHFAVRGIDLTRLESRPTGEGLGEYQFWIDANAHLTEARMAEALLGLRRTCRDLRFLGSYPRADGRADPVPDHADDAAYAAAAAWVRGLSGPAAASGPSHR